MIFGRWLMRIAVPLCLLLAAASIAATVIGRQSNGRELAYSQFNSRTGAACLHFLDVEHGITMSRWLAYLPSQIEWSPDGTQLALGYVDWVEIVDLNGTKQRIDSAHTPMWDSTGRLVVFYLRSSGWQLYHYDLERAEFGEPISQRVEYEVLAGVLSPDDHQLAFTGNDRQGQSGLFILDLASSAPRFIVPMQTLLHSFSIAWSRDSRALVSSRWLVGARSSLTSLDVENENEYSLTDSDDYLLFPSWSPSGTQLAFINRDLLQMRQTLGLLYMDGTLREIDINALSGLSVMEMEHPEWSPDEQAIVLLLNINRERFIYLLSLENEPTLQRLTTAGADVFAWRP